MPHQQYIMDVALEHDADGVLFYDEVDLSIMRQMGKTTCLFSKMTWRSTMAARRWGPQRTTYTAQARQMARRKLERDFAETLRGQSSFREVTNPKARPAKANEWKLSLNNGSEHILFGRGNYLQIDAPTKTAGHGDTLDDGNIDEAFAHRDDSIEQAMRPAQATRFNAQLWVLSTAGDENSHYLWQKVKAGRAQIESGQPSRVAYFEWSIPDDADIDDEDVWHEFLPALGYGPGQTSPEFIRGELERARRKTEDGGEDLWRRAYGNQWVKVPMSGPADRKSKLPAEAWAAAATDAVFDIRPGEITLAFDVTKDGEASAIAVGAGDLSAPYVECIDDRSGVGWLPDELVRLVQKWKPIAVGVNAAGAAGAQVGPILEAFRAADISADLLVPMSAGEYSRACGGFYTDVTEGRLRRRIDGPLDRAGGEAAERTIGAEGGWAWDRRSSTVSIAPLVAATIARALLPTEVEQEPESDFIVI